MRVDVCVFYVFFSLFFFRAMKPGINFDIDNKTATTSARQRHCSFMFVCCWSGREGKGDGAAEIIVGCDC